LIGCTVYDTNGDKVGSIAQVWLDDDTGQPEWVSVNTGLLGMKESFLPVQGLSGRHDGNLETPYDKDRVKSAPNVDPDGEHLDASEEQRLYQHYEISDGGTRGRAHGSPYDNDRTVGHDVSGPTTDDAMTRSEERLRVGTERREAGRVRLRKYVVTETEKVDVPVTREQVRVEREPITDANRGRAMSGPAISEEEHEVTLHEERPVVDTEAVPVERVRLAKDTVADRETVAGEVRKERIETDGSIDETRR